MAETITYDPSNDPQAIEAAEKRDAETLAVGQAMEDAQNNLLAGKYKSAQDLEKAYIELQQKLGSNDQQTESQQEDTTEPESESNPAFDLFDSIDDEMADGGQLSEASIEKLAAMDSKDLVDAYFKYQDTLEDGAPVEGRELSDGEVSAITSEGLEIEGLGVGAKTGVKYKFEVTYVHPNGTCLSNRTNTRCLKVDIQVS